MVAAPCSIVSSSTYIELSSIFGWSFGIVGLEYSTKGTGERGDPWGSPELKVGVFFLAFEMEAEEAVGADIFGPCHEVPGES